MKNLIDIRGKELKEQYSALPLMRKCVTCKKLHNANRARNVDEYHSLCEECSGYKVINIEPSWNAILTMVERGFAEPSVLKPVCELATIIRQNQKKGLITHIDPDGTMRTEPMEDTQ